MNSSYTYTYFSDQLVSFIRYFTYISFEKLSRSIGANDISGITTLFAIYWYPVFASFIYLVPVFIPCLLFLQSDDRRERLDTTCVNQPESRLAWISDLCLFPSVRNYLMENTIFYQVDDTKVFLTQLMYSNYSSFCIGCWLFL